MKGTFAALVCGLALVCTGCSTIESARQLKNMADCKYSFAGVENFQFAGVSLDKLSNYTSLSIADANQIFTALRNGKGQLTFNALVDIQNPNSGTASLEKLDWKLLLKDTELLNGVSLDPVKIAGKSTARAAIKANLEPSNVLSSNTVDSLWSLYKSLSGQDGTGAPTLTLKLKPTVGGYTPSEYLTVKKQL